MNDYQFVASTVDGEKKTSLLGAVALLAPAALLLLLLKGLLPNLITNQGLLWLVVVVPSLVIFSAVMRLMQKHYVGTFTIRLEGKHVTLVSPNHNVMDLGQVVKVSLNYSIDYKRADLHIVGSKDEAMIRLRSAATWNGKSQARDFNVADKAVADINAALEQHIAA